MPLFEDSIIAHHDGRIATLARIKSRSLGADALTLTALNVLAYAQLEGGVKDLSACVIRHLNARNMTLGDIAPRILKWRNQDEIQRLKNAVDFDMIGNPLPFAMALTRRVKVRPINRKREFSQMSWTVVKSVYDGFGIDPAGIARSAQGIDALVSARNDAAHHGTPSAFAAPILEKIVRENVSMVEGVLTDLSVRLITYFADGLHRR